MHENCLNAYNSQCQHGVQQNPNAVSINIFSPAAYGNKSVPSGMAANGAQAQNSCMLYPNNSIYSSVPNPNISPYPVNYNNLINYPNAYPNGQTGYNNAQMPNGYNPSVIPNAGYNNAQMPNGYNPPMNNPAIGYPVPSNPNALNGSKSDMLSDAKGNTINKLNTSNEKSEKNTENTKAENKTSNKDEKHKVIIPLTDEYIKSLENYLNSDNSKIRLTGIKNVIDRFKEDEDRRDNPSPVPLLNKALQDSSPSVRFLALTALQLDYTKGDNITVQILKNMVENSKENYGEDAILASEALLKIATPDAVVKGGN